MKIRIDISNDNEEEIVIKCKKYTNKIEDLEKLITSLVSDNQLVLYKDKEEYYIPLDNILFFDTDISVVNAHTKDDIHDTKYKLYELESILPYNFMRISKSTIVNIKHIFSINKGITSSSEIQFNDTHKKVYVSRMYIKELKNKLKGRY